MQPLSQHRRSIAFKLLAIVCLLLLGAMLFAQAVHSHPATAADEHCSLCVALHVAPLPVVAQTQALPAPMVEFLAVQFEKAPPAREALCSHCIRPPPNQV